MDLRERVEDDRGLIKKIQLAIPGFRGYRIKEDLRIADRLLREQLADRLASASKKADACRDKLVDKQELDLLEKVRKLVNESNTVIERVRHAEHGYTGVSPDYRIDASQLNKMYEWDLKLLDYIKIIREGIDNLDEALANNNMVAAKTNMETAIEVLANFNEIFSMRREAIAGLLIEGE